MLRLSTLRRLTLIGAGAALFQFSSCGLGDIGRAVARFNPCLTILACDPTFYEFVRSDYEGPGADPYNGVYFTTLPPYTADTDDPYFIEPLLNERP